jgi:hypothetical protein
MTHFFRNSLAGLLACGFALPATATSWQCRNDVEIQCDQAACTVAKPGEFTPLGLSFTSGGRFSLCAYSGCWEGQGKVVARKPFLVIEKRQAAWSDPQTKNASDILIAFAQEDRIALVKAGGLALPLHCEKGQ